MGGTKSVDAIYSWAVLPTPTSVTAWARTSPIITSLYFDGDLRAHPTRVPGQPVALFPNPLLSGDLLTSYFD